MKTEGVRVVLAVPAVPGMYPVEPGSRVSVAGTVRRALKVAQWLEPGAALDIVTYGASRGHARTVRSSVGSDEQLTKWVKDWAVTSNGLEAEPNVLERTFDVRSTAYGARILEGVVAADAWVGESDRTTLVIFWVANDIESAKVVRVINKAGRTTVFWQFFGIADKLETYRWARDGLDVGRVLPYVRFGYGESWGKRWITRGFRRWLRRRGE